MVPGRSSATCLLKKRREALFFDRQTEKLAGFRGDPSPLFLITHHATTLIALKR